MCFVFMASPWKLIQCRFSSGQRVSLLVQAGKAAPLHIVIHVQLKLRYRAYNTAAAHLRAIKAFYTYTYTYTYTESRDLDHAYVSINPCICSS